MTGPTGKTGRDPFVEIQQLLARYCRYVDHGYGGRVADLFTPEGSFRFGAIELRGRREIETFYERRLARAPGGRHVVTNVIIELEGADARVTSTIILFRGLSPSLVADYEDVVAYESTDGWLRVIVDIPPGRTADIRCVYHEQPDALPDSESVSYRLRVAVRRYLSELRDNYGYLFRFRV